MRVDILVRLQQLFGTSLLCCHCCCNGGLVIEVFDDSDTVGADVVLHGCQKSCMPKPVEGLLEVYEDMVEILLVLETFLMKDS